MYGGDSAEREVSLASGSAVYQALLDAGVDTVAFDPAAQSLTELKGVSKVLIMLHGRGGEDGTMQGALQALGIPYTGSGVLGSALAMDKIRSKQVFSAAGIPTADYEIVDKAELSRLDAKQLMSALGNEVMVKPACEGSSIGMSRVTDAGQLYSAVQTALQFDQRVLLEKYVTGLEFTVAILNGEVLPSIRMETPRSFYDYEAKYQTNSTSYHCPSGLSDEQESELAELALRAFNAVGAEGWGRVDAMQDSEGRFYVLEVNTVPGMTQKSLVPMAAKAAGISFTDLVLAVLKSSALRK